ncbi:MAG: Hpt domain-containing protein [Candidatus Binatia bacterium]
MPAAVLDREAALVCTDGDEEIFAELARILLERIPALVARMHQAVGEGDGTALNFCAHSLKGSAANVGAAAVCETAALMERLSESGLLEEAAALVSVLEKQLAALAAELSSVIRAPA